MVDHYNVDISSEKIVPKLQWGDSYLEVSRPKQIEELFAYDDTLRARRSPHYSDFVKITRPGLFTSILTVLPQYYKKLDPSKKEKPPSPFEKYYDEAELTRAVSKQFPIMSGNSLLFPTLSDCNKENFKMLNIVNMFQFIDADGILLYRQNNLDIHVTKKDEYHILECPDMRTSEQLRLDESFIKPFTRKPFFYTKMSGTLCDRVLTVKDPYDLLIMNLNIFKYSERSHTEYRNTQSHLAVASQLTKILKKGGTYIFSQHNTLLKLTNDFFHILANMFESVKVIKLINRPRLQPYKSVVCTGFKSDEVLEQTIRAIYEKWLAIELSCGMSVGGKIVQRLLGGTSDIKSIQSIIENDVRLSIQVLEETEQKMKTPELIPLYIDDSKLESMYIYGLMKVPIPISLLYKATDLKRMFYQPAGVNIIIQRSLNRDRVLHAEFNELRKKMEIELFIIKRQIDYVNNIEQYSKITDMFKITNRVLKYPSQKIIGQPVSQAFLKMCEMLHDTELVRTRKIDVFHLCEAPGQFILAFRHYCNQKHIIKSQKELVRYFCFSLILVVYL